MEVNATTICLNSIVDGKQPSLQDRVYDCNGVSTAHYLFSAQYCRAKSSDTTSMPFRLNDCCGGGDREPKILTPRRTDFGKSIRKQYESHQVNMSRHDMTQLEPREDGVSNILTSVQKDNLVAEPLLIPEATTKGYAEAYDGDSVNLALPNSKTRRGRVGHQQANTLDTSCNQGVVTNYRIRKLTPRECFRLMDVSETDIDKLLNAGISNSRLYKLAGNSIVCSVIYHVMRKMFIEKENENQQLTLF